MGNLIMLLINTERFIKCLTRDAPLDSLTRVCFMMKYKYVKTLEDVTCNNKKLIHKT